MVSAKKRESSKRAQRIVKERDSKKSSKERKEFKRGPVFLK